jgi:hypothetical protein
MVVAQCSHESLFGLSVMVELLVAAAIIGRPLQAPHGRTQSEHEELRAIDQHARSSKVDIRTDVPAEPAVFQARRTVEAITVPFGSAIHAPNSPEAKRIWRSFHFLL